MAEKRVELKTFSVRLLCDACGGTMQYTGVSLMSNPKKYAHKCEKCGVSVDVVGKIYPHLDYEVINGE